MRFNPYRIVKNAIRKRRARKARQDDPPYKYCYGRIKITGMNDWPPMIFQQKESRSMTEEQLTLPLELPPPKPESRYRISRLPMAIPTDPVWWAARNGRQKTYDD